MRSVSAGTPERPNPSCRRGKRIAVGRKDLADGVEIRFASKPSVVLAHMDNGIHSKPPTGPTVEKPLNEVPGAKSATSAVKFHKTIVEWNAQSTRAFGQAFEVVPLEPTQPRAGMPLVLRVLRDGKPLAGVRLGRDEEPGEGAPTSDADGRVTIVPSAGVNRWWAGKRFPVQTPQFTELSYEYSLVFEAK
ncbi:DUF4198 domain-containing protein [bacterium]|nr:MAG: DUF4198 domain-containing protein [bacterium]